MLNNNATMNEVTPLEFYLCQNYPNPFKDKTTIKYCVAYKTRVQIKIYDSKDQLIRKLVDEEKNAGTYEIEFRPAEGNRQLSNGDYYYCLVAGDYTCEKKMILLR